MVPSPPPLHDAERAQPLPLGLRGYTRLHVTLTESWQTSCGSLCSSRVAGPKSKGGQKFASVNDIFKSQILSPHSSSDSRQLTGQNLYDQLDATE